MSLASDTLVSVEIVILILLGVFFSMMYEMDRRLTWSGIIASMVWMVSGIYYFIIFGKHASGVISLLFTGISLIYIVRWIIDIASMRNLGRLMEDDGGEW